MTDRKREDGEPNPVTKARTSEVHDPREANADLERESENAGVPLPIEENDFNSQPQ